MFLLKVWKHSKLLCTFFILFALLQIVINYKGGMVFSPFYHYGMYSAKATILPTYTVPVIYSKGKIVQGKNFTTQQWDKIFVGFNAFTQNKIDEQFTLTETKRLGEKFKIPLKSDAFENHVKSLNLLAFKNTIRSIFLDTIQYEIFSWNGKILTK